ncbi:wall-associated receptor kinase-like 1 [Eucalyptus grandis]|uniref:wall-associated receptor kinase-like 1 n=1 Tax=Eucalyptus grandis TaxID=71139 RepID=UPI00192EAF9A|nr:wall-associated receptor kinase-like 1 [Eucalyptus grandis]
MFQILLLLGSLLLHKQASLAAPLGKGNCTLTCGGVAIPFPFGIGTGCFQDEWYEIVCQESSNGTVPILKKPNLRVLNISLPDSYGKTIGMVNVVLPIIYSPNMSCGGKGSFTPVSLKGSQFVFSQSRNVFAAVGCNISALIRDTKSVIKGCQSSCEADNNVVRKTCSGSNGCCQTTIPSNLQDFTVTFQAEEKTAGDNGCNYAFFGDRSQFIPSTMDFNELRASGQYAAVLEWKIANSSGPELYEQNFISDVDECRDSTNWCPDRKCVNRLGHYDCVEESEKIKFILVGIGAGLGALTLLQLLWLSHKLMKFRKEIKLKERYFKQNGGLLLQQQLCLSKSNVDRDKLFSSRDLEKATDNFNKNRILGQGGQGTVYKGMLADGGIVAIKKLEAIYMGKVEQFINANAILLQINHRNIVKLLRCCLETESPLLVYEFISNGTLFQNLHDNIVTWDMRLRIATEVARALSCLHSPASIPTYHWGIKSTNILLDDKYCTKVAAFATSKSVLVDKTDATTRVQGTFGYLDPEYLQSDQFTDKSDMYSFGLILVELLTGQEPMAFLGDDKEINLASYFLLLMSENRLFDTVDTRVLKQGEKEGIVPFANLARRCLKSHGKMRHTMKEVEIELDLECWKTLPPSMVVPKRSK